MAVVGLLDGLLGKLRSVEGCALAALLPWQLSDHLSSLRNKIYYSVSIDEPAPHERELINRAYEIFYDIDDWIDLLVIRISDDAGGGGWSKPLSPRFLRWLRVDAYKLTTLPTNHVISNALQHLKTLVVELDRHYSVLAFPSLPRSIDPRLTTLFVDPGDLVGLDGPIKEVANMAMDAGNKAKLKIVSIVGMAGSGKTTLANAVYKRLGEQNFFQCLAFVSMGLKPDLRRTVMGLLSMLAIEHRVDADTDHLIVSLREILDKKRYLIVVDDLWSREHWETIICRCFPENSLGSKIIITTRNVALVTECDSIYNIELLSEIDSRRLILNRAFSTVHGFPQDLEYLPPRITTRCGGLPLALVTVASMLTDQPSMGELGRLMESRWLSISHPHAEAMKWIINLSYIDLPPHLRTCMLYLSIFPEDCMVEIERLVMLWIAEGFIPKEHGKSVEETGRSYLNELIGRNIVQPLHQKHDEFRRYCSIHPVVHDFIVCKSMDENFVTSVNVDDNQYFSNNNGTGRRLSLQSNSNLDQAMARNDYTDLSHVRSISVFCQASSTPPFTDLKMLRVLDLEGCDGPVCLDGLSTLLFLRYLSLRGTDVSELPTTIGELRWLQILDVSSTKLKELPPSIGALQHLTYLNLRDTDISDLPAAIGKLRCLETLDVRSTKVKELPPSFLNLKHTLKALLVGAKGMINLVETATRIPEDIQDFQSLEKLGTIDLNEHHAGFVKTLGWLKRLRVLKITWSTQQCTERAYCEALLVSSIEKWSQLESLTIHCGFLCSMEFLDSLRNPPGCLNKFKVTAGKFAAVPQWINGLGFLSFMQITICKLGSDDLRILRDLPNLKCLILGLEFIPSAAILIEYDGFKELTRFSIDCPVPWLTFRTGAIPKLTYLELKFCSGPASLESVPSGISNLQSLTEVVLCYNQTWCSNSSSDKMTVAAVKEEVAKHRNPIELVINDIIVNVPKVEEATEIYNEAATSPIASSSNLPRSEIGGEATDDVRDDVEVAGERTSKITSEIEEIEDDTEEMVYRSQHKENTIS
ncbi:unnamed protein product [Urochloa decumbens]|uniref:NB-ARC domain-containing protein n=1 Tax=Urochloa decumbens TaxID=240449 RepID=A0ABC9AIZ4_9POAL